MTTQSESFEKAFQWVPEYSAMTTSRDEIERLVDATLEGWWDVKDNMRARAALLSAIDRALAERDARIAVLEKALREARGYVHARLLEAAKDRHSFVSANAAESLRLIDAALATEQTHE